MIRRDDEQGLSTLVTWNLVNNAEINQYEVEDPFQVSFDDDGNCAIVRSGVIDIDDRCTKVTAFDFDDNLLEEAKTMESVVDDEQLGAGIFSFSKGSRFNAKGHDRLIFDNYLSLSFSYMSFVIKDMIERNDPHVKLNQFDIEPYNYLFNKRTSFTDDCALLHIDDLKEVLDNFSNEGSEMLSILNYTRPIQRETEDDNPESASSIFDKGLDIKHQLSSFASNINPLELQKKMKLLLKQNQIVADADSALHLALTNRHALNVDLILEKMAECNSSDDIKDPSMHFKDIMHDLVDYNNFKLYLESMVKTTPEMERQKVVRVLKDSSVNMCSLLCCSKKQYEVN